VHSETDASLASSGNCRHWATGLGGRQAAHSRPSDRRRRTPDGRACCDDVVVRRDGGGWKIESLTTGNVRCGVAAVHEVLGSLALDTRVNCHSELMEDSLRNTEPVQLGVEQMCQASVTSQYYWRHGLRNSANVWQWLQKNWRYFSAARRCGHCSWPQRHYELNGIST